MHRLAPMLSNMCYDVTATGSGGGEVQKALRNVPRG
jgi:hypothetical protein